jgi:surfeit locus 1 family protein
MRYFCVFFIIVFSVLGCWQLHRYAYKKNLLQTHQKITLTGHYINNLTLFLQNRYYQGQYGIEVITPFKIAGENKLLLVNRGWIKTNNATVPIQNIQGKQKITGNIKLFEPEFILGKIILKQTPTELIIQKIDINALSKATHEVFYPFVLRLDTTQPHGFVRDWVITTIPPERHMAYAIQWFLMAAVLVVIFLRVRF